MQAIFSASPRIFLQLEERDLHCGVLFSGDLGNIGGPLLPNPAIPPKTDVVVLETTYGNRLHKPLHLSVDELYQAINETFAHRGET